LRGVRRPLVAAMALFVLATAATDANAYRSLNFERGGAIRSVFETRIAFVGSIIMISCDLTMNGELRPGPYARELPIVVGEVSSIEWSECTGGEILEILNFPWNIRIDKILETRATEPRIAGIRPEAVTGMLVSLVESGGGRPVGWDLTIRGVFCLYGGRGESPAALLPLTRLRESSGRFTYELGSLTILEEVRFRKNSGPETCPGEGFIRGRFAPLEPTQTAIFQ
jgi:hypothetical protein